MAPIVVNRFYTVPFKVEFTVTLDRIGWIQGTLAGNCRGGIYRDNGDTPVGGALIVDSGLLAVPAGAQRKKEIPIVSTRLTPGLYWVGATFDDIVNTINRIDLTVVPDGTLPASWFLNAPAAALANPYPAIGA
ncbi:unnamed protein product, partial [marine sediment metagenome]